MLRITIRKRKKTVLTPILISSRSLLYEESATWNMYIYYFEVIHYFGLVKRYYVHINTAAAQQVRLDMTSQHISTTVRATHKI